MIVLLFIIGIFFGAMGGILMKIGAGDIGQVQLSSASEAVSFLIKMFTNLPVVGGIALYFLSALIWLVLLTKLDISFVQPILALTYVITPLLAIVFLNESVPPQRWIGIAVIIVGVVLVARTSTN